MPTDVQHLYGTIWSDLDPPEEAWLGHSLSPRGPEMLFDAFATFGPRSSDRVLDAGGRDAIHAIELAHRFGCQVTMMDIVPLHVERAREAIAASEVADRVEAVLGDIAAMPFDNASFDHLWCRDVLSHVDPQAAFAEFSRVLQPGGGMLLYLTMATDLLEPRERRWLIDSLAFHPRSLDVAAVEAEINAAGFTITEKQIIGSEWREQWLESGNRRNEEDLLRLSRLRRQWPAMVEAFGETACNAILAGASWGLYQFLGKTEPTLYLLRRRP